MRRQTSTSPTAATGAIQVFDGEGTFRASFTIDVPYEAQARPAIGNLRISRRSRRGAGRRRRCPVRPGRCASRPVPKQVLYASDAFPGRVFKLSLDGKVLGVLGESGKQLKQFGWIHEIACPSENVLYVADCSTWRGAEAGAESRRNSGGRGQRRFRSPSMCTSWPSAEALTGAGEPPVR